MSQATLEELFGNVIFSYTRRQALEDGVLIDLSENFPEDTVIYKFPVACTASVWALIEAEDGELNGIVWDLCWMSAKGGIVSRPDPTTVIFKVIIGRRTHTLKAVCGPNDDASPCITVMGLDED